jgi:hypothetical protein
MKRNSNTKLQIIKRSKNINVNFEENLNQYHPLLHVGIIKLWTQW